MLPLEMLGQYLYKIHVGVDIRDSWHMYS